MMVIGRCKFTVGKFRDRNARVSSVVLGQTARNPITLRTAKTLESFGCSECSRVKGAVYFRVFTACYSATSLTCQMVKLIRSNCGRIIEIV